jgi:sensor histidine kinase YesM
MHQARSVAAVFIYTIAIGTGLHVVTERIERRWPNTLYGALGLVRHLALTALVVLALTSMLAHPLGWVCPGLAGQGVPLLMRGLVLSAGYLLLGRAYARFVRQREEAAAGRAKAERLLAEARYAALVSRTQPHFLHNALAAAAGLVPNDPSAAERMLRDLGSLFREVVHGTERAIVRAEEELETARRYLDIQAARFTPNLRARTECSALAKDEHVPALVLLPLVENAVLHGMRPGKVLTVTVKLELDRTHVRFVVCDDGPGPLASSHRGAGVGLSDVRERLRTLYGPEASLDLREAGLVDGPGTIAELRIPREEI